MNSEIPRTLYRTEHEIFRESVAKFLRDEGRTPLEIWRRAGEFGILGTSIPEEYGGMGGDFLYDSIVIEELGRNLAPKHGEIIKPNSIT